MSFSRTRNTVITLLAGCFLTTSAIAQSSKHFSKILFRDGCGIIEPLYNDNQERLHGLITTLEELLADSNIVISGIEFTSSTSPTGSYAFNKRLAKERVTSTENYIRNRVPLLGINIQKDSCIIGYDKLRQMVFASNMLYRNEVLSILDNTPEFIYDKNLRLIDSRKKQLMNLKYGRAWKYMSDTFFPELRNACVIVVHTVVKVPVAAPIPKATIPPIINPDTISIEQDNPSPDQPVISNSADKEAYHRPLLALKTNLLYDAVTALNVELEVPIKKRWSVAIEIVFPWWKSKSSSLTMQLLTGNVEGKYWFGNRANREVLTGWNAGVYAGGGMFDLQPFNKKGIQGEFFIAAGLSAGYAHKITKHLRMEYSLGLGYMQTNYKEYELTRNTEFGDIKVWKYPWATSRNRWFGPTKAKVSFVWLINAKCKKGGKR
ncbi:MAG: DUF3575 domain-containing protein [Bacteroidales bacterium]